MDARKKTFLAAALGLIWMGVALWQWDAFTEPMRVPLTHVSGLPSAGQAAREKAGGLQVNLGLLASARTQREATFTTPRNIFAFPRADGTLPVGTEAVPPVPTETISDQALAQQAAMVELAQYRYLGYLRMGAGHKQNKAMAVLSKNEEVVVVKVGEHVEGHLLLKAITAESVTIRDTGAKVEHTLPLSEEPPVQP